MGAAYEQKYILTSMYNMPVRIVRRRGGRQVNVRARNVAGRANKARKNLKALVAKVLKGQSETKYVSNALADNTTPLTANWYAPVNLTTVGTYHPAIPAVTQGVGDFQRIGNKIMPTSLKTTLNFGYKATDVSCNEIIVTVYYGTTKAGKTWQAGTPIQSPNDLLDNGDGTTGAFTGMKADLLYPINKAMNNAKRIIFRMGKTEGVLMDNGGSGAVANGAYATSNGGSFHSLTLTHKPPKALVYDQTGYQWPSNYAPWYAVSFTRVDDRATSNALDNQLLVVSALNHMYFKDV